MKHEIYGKIDGPIVMIGFGTVGRGALPLLERHFEFDKERLTVIDPKDDNRQLLDERNIRYMQLAITDENYREILEPLLTTGGQGFVINVSVDVCSLEILKLARALNALYIDTCIEPWAGVYDDKSLTTAERSNYASREQLLAEKRKNPGGTTAVSACGANPGMVSWFVKAALLNLAKDIGLDFKQPKSKAEWAKLMQTVGIKGIHVAERDTQRATFQRPFNQFVNTWSVEGFIAEGLQPAELGWGTHEKWRPDNAKDHDHGCKAAIYLEQPGAATKVRTWCPTLGPQHGFLVTHNESISLADYFTVKDGDKVEYRPTCHYAYHPCNDALVSWHETFGNEGEFSDDWIILDENQIADGHDELGVLLYGHEKNAYWYGSTLTIEETRQLASYQNATALQVTSALLAGMVWALENPEEGIIEAEEMDHKRCLEIQIPYLGKVKGYYTDWTPIDTRLDLFPDDIDTEDPWQFKNILVKN